MNQAKKVTRIKIAKNELTKALISLDRAEKAILDELKIINECPAYGTENQQQLNKWGQKFHHIRLIVDLDTHNLINQRYHALNYLNRISQIKKVIPDKIKEDIEMMRHNYEHWEEIGPIYRSTLPKNVLVTKGKKAVKRYIELYRTDARESPRGYLSFNYDKSSDPSIPLIVIGNVLNLRDIKHILVNLVSGVERL